MATRKVWESPSGHRRVEQASDGTLYELLKDTNSKIVLSVKEIDAARLDDVMNGRPSSKETTHRLGFCSD